MLQSVNLMIYVDDVEKVAAFLSRQLGRHESVKKR